jgi:hypothetical protein
VSHELRTLLVELMDLLTQEEETLRKMCVY